MIRHAVPSLAVIAALLMLPALPAGAQSASDFSARDKTEVFIQHVVKFMDLQPEKYQALVLRYEVGTALAEVSELQLGDLDLNFIREALRELVPEYGQALERFEAGKETEARQAVEPLLAHPDPYIAANAGLLRAELDFLAGDYAAVIARCERLAADARLRLIDDHRACELIARCFEKQEKPLLAFAQYMILTVDYQDLPRDVETRAKERIGALGNEVGKPLHTVAAWMDEVEKLLFREVTDNEPTQKKEREIVTALDKLIELQEAIERNTCSNCGGGNCKGGCKNGRPKGNRSNSHAQVSALPPPGEGITNLRGVSNASAESIWGQLRARDASRALQSFSGKLPARYERLLEQYYRELARER